MMFNMKKILLLIILLLITGCDKNNINKTFQNMKNSNYEMDIKINGIDKGKQINDIVRLTNNKNEKNKIIYLNENEIIYKQKNNFYKKENDKYIKIEGKYLYTNHNLCLELINDIKKINSKTKETINNKEYTIYNIIVKKDNINKILKDTYFKEKTVYKDITCDIYITKNYNLYRTNCDLKNYIESTSNVKLDITYFNIYKLTK